MVVVDPRIIAKTERLLLRPLELKDAEDVLLMRKHPEVMKHTSILPSNDIEKTTQWIQGCHDRDNCWNFVIEMLAISKADSVVEHYDTEMSPRSIEPSCERTAPRVIGLIGAVRAPEVGYMLNADYWGRGYATEAMRAFMSLFWKHNDYAYAEAQTDPELESSQNVLRKVGFNLHEKRDKDFENPILGWRDTLVFRMDRPSEAA
ncbi:acyl-CoA N-acyltransferase [Didymella exigua CBS 183.55]|uniref:Acyl-CoA N-acyltransferase n=1 Tax=Didymella exigua CBS 183.55 TaxID=1150837 RepID=A0A6A5RJQ6_9PLEO|nr:acyl-CoA N-acyltransferase [Didymella exigua CBS 183.55]KAF1925807.1 acyl-CoA N-acyltransferase [Didymella exigua CBS 183.55]